VGGLLNSRHLNDRTRGAFAISPKANAKSRTAAIGHASKDQAQKIGLSVATLKQHGWKFFDGKWHKPVPKSNLTRGKAGWEPLQQK
jgi:hypothetical protein